MSPDRKLMGEAPMSPSKDLMSVKPTGLPPGVTADQVRAEADSETPTAEEQQLYDKFVARAIAFIHGEQTQPQVLQMLNNENLPVHEAVGKTAARVGQLIEKSAKDAGQELPPDVIYAAGQEIVADLLETGVEAKIFPLQVDSKEYDDALNMAFLEAVKAYGEDLLRGPDGEQISAKAQDEYARQVAMEADAGELDAGFAAALQQEDFARQTPVAAGVQQALGT